MFGASGAWAATERNWKDTSVGGSEESPYNIWETANWDGSIGSGNHLNLSVSEKTYFKSESDVRIGNDFRPNSGDFVFLGPLTFMCLKNNIADASVSVLKNGDWKIQDYQMYIGYAAGSTMSFTNETGNVTVTGSRGYLYIADREGSTGEVVKESGDWSFEKTAFIGNGKDTTARFYNRGGNLAVAGDLVIARGEGSSAEIVKESGDWSASSTVYIGNGKNSTARFYNRGGFLTAAQYGVCLGENASGTTGSAYLEISGGAITNTAGNLSIGDGNSGGTAEVRVNGGEYCAQAGSVFVGSRGRGTLTIDSGRVIASASGVRFCDNALCVSGRDCFLNLNGGTLETKTVTYGSGAANATFTFNGGTLKALSQMNIIQAHDHLTVNVSEKGGTIDNNGKDISIEESFNGTGTINLTGSGTTTFAAGVGAEGSVSVADGTTLALDGATQSSFGALTLAAGSTLDIATPVSDSAAFAATTLNLPAEGTVTLTSGGGAFGEGLYAICEMSEMIGVMAEAGAKFAPLISTETLEFEWSVVDNTLMLAVGAINPNTWTGGANNGNLSDPKNWLGGAVPESGTATINTSGELTVGTLFSPDVIVFPETCGAVTITGENGITGLSAVTNLSSSTCTFEVPVAFADEICVSQGAYYYYNNSNNQPTLSDGGKVRFAGGVTGTSFADGTSRRLDGAFTIPASANWAASTTVGGLWTVMGGSSLMLTGYPSEQQANDFSCLNNNGAFTTAVIRTSSSPVCLRNEGEFVVTEELTVTLPGEGRHIAQRGSLGKYKFEKVTLGDNGNSGLFYIANRGTWYADKHVYIGAGGLCFAEGAQPNTAYAFGRQASDDIYIYPWHSDYTIGAKGGTTRDIIVIEPTYFQTDDADGVARTVTLNGIADVHRALTVKGHGRFQVNSDGMNSESDWIGGITVTDSATLAYASGADLGAGAVTVGVNATLEVASGAHTFGGGLTLNDGATLAFNFTERTVAPQISIAAGKELTVKGAVKVKIPADSKWPTAGEKVLTTCGGFTADKVSLVDGAPKWVRGLSVVDGNIVLDVKPRGTRVIVR